MAKLQTKTYDRRRRSPTSRLLCCFGISQKPEEGSDPIPTVDPSEHQKGKHRITVRLAFLGLRVPKSNRITSAKTVPVSLEKDIKLIHYKSKPKSKSTTDQSSPTTTTVVPTTPDKIPKDKPLQVFYLMYILTTLLFLLFSSLFVSSKALSSLNTISWQLTLPPYVLISF